MHVYVCAMSGMSGLEQIGVLAYDACNLKNRSGIETCLTTMHATEGQVMHRDRV